MSSESSDQKSIIITNKEDTENKKNNKNGNNKKKNTKNISSDLEDISSSASSSSNDEAEKDEAEIRQKQELKSNLVAHFYKFQEESGNPENLAPQLGGNDVDIYRFYNVVKRMGGHRSITKENKWSKVLKKLKLDLSKGEIDALQVKKTYIVYFEKFESFMNKLGNSSLIVSAASSSSTSQRNTRIVRTIATPSQTSGDIKTSKRSRGGKSSSTRGGSSGGTLSRSRSSSSVKDHSPAFSVCTKSSTKSSKKSSEEPQELQPLHFSFSSSTTSTSQHFEPPNMNKRSMSFIIERGKTLAKYIKKSSPSITQKIGKEEKSCNSNTIKGQQQHPFVGEIKKPSLPLQINKVKPVKSHDSIISAKSILAPSEKLKKTLSAFTSSTSTPSTSGGSVTITPSTSGGSVTITPSTSGGSAKKNNEGTISEELGQAVQQQHQNFTKILAQSSTKIETDLSNSPQRPQQHIKIPQPRGRKPKHLISQQKQQKNKPQTENDIGYSYAHIFTRFYQGQKVSARHHLRFYDARVITVKQPSLSDIARTLNNAFALSRITHQGSPELKTLSLENMGPELKDALRNLMNSTKIFVHYLGWNSRYDEWLMLHKIRVDEKDERSSAQHVENHLIKSSSGHNLPPQLLAAALDWCASPEGIPSLALLPSAQSSEQRPRRLSSSALAKATTPVSSVADSVNNVQIVPRRQSTSCSTSTTSTMDYRSPLNPFAPHHAPPPSSSSSTSSSNDTTFTAPLLNASTHSLGKFTIPHLPVVPLTVSETPSTSATVYLTNIEQLNDIIVKEEPEENFNNQKHHLSPKHTKVKTFSSSPTKVQLISNLKTHPSTTTSLTTTPSPTTTTTTNISLTTTSTTSSICFPIIAHNQQQIVSQNDNQQLFLDDDKSSVNVDEISSSSSSLIEGTGLIVSEPQQLNIPSQQTTIIKDIKPETSSPIQHAFGIVEEENGEGLFRLSPPPAPPILTIKEEERVYGDFEFEKDAVKGKAKITLPTNESTSTSLDVTPPKSSNTLQIQPWAPKKRKSVESIVGAMSPPNKLAKNNLKSPARPTNSTAATLNTFASPTRSPFVGNNETTSDEEENGFEDEMLEKCADEPDQQVKLIEQRMRELHGIFHEYKTKLSELEKQNRRRRKKEQQSTISPASRSIIPGGGIVENI
uniref:ARID domain-containing protein n=1 Tax=Meloidogyne hapla TaxID=6305 RepID=A0A1I8BQ06_MELHA